MVTTVNKASFYGRLFLPLGRRQRSIYFKKSILPYTWAEAIAATLQDVTGDEIRIIGGNRGWFVERWTGSEWVKG